MECQIDRKMRPYNVKIIRMYRKEASLTTENNFQMFSKLFQVTESAIGLCFDVVVLHLFWHK